MKALRRIARLLARVLVFVLCLLVLAGSTAYVALRLMVTPEGLKSIFVAQLQEAFHRPVQISDVRVLLSQGIRVRGLKVLEAPGFPGNEFVSSEVLLAKYDWRSLIRGRLDITELRLVAPRIQVTRRQDGQWSVEDIFVSSGPRTAAATAGPLKLPVSLAAEVIAIDHGLMTVSDLKRRSLYEIQAFDLEMRGFDPDRAFPLTASFRNFNNFGGKKAELRVSLQGAIDLASLHWEKAEFSAEKLKVTVDGDQVSATGSVKDFLNPSIGLRVKVPAVTSAMLSRYWPVPDGISVPQTLWRIRLDVPEPGEVKLVSLDGTAEPLSARASGSLSLKPKSRRFRLTLAAAGVPLAKLSELWSGWAKYRLWGTGDASMTVSGDLLAEARPPRIESLALALKGVHGVFHNDKEVKLADLRIDGKDGLDTLSVAIPRATLVAYGETFSDIDVALHIRKGDLELDGFNVAWKDSHLTIKKGTVRELAAPKEVLLEGSLDKLRLDETIALATSIVTQYKPPEAKPEGAPRRLWSQVFKYAIPKSFPATAGTLTIGEVTHPNFNTFNLKLLWDLRGISTGLDKLEGSIRAGFGPGRVTNVPELQGAHKILRVLFLPFVFMHKLNNLSVLSGATAYPKTLDFTQIKGEYGLKAGVVDTRFFRVDSPQLQAFADGTVDFPREKVDLHVLTRLESKRSQLPEFLVDEKGRPSIGFFVKDDLNKPTLEVEFRKMKPDAIEAAFEEAIKRGRPSFLKTGPPNP